MSKRALLGLLVFLPQHATAQRGQELARPNTIIVSASGKVETAPDVATMDVSIRGEGRTPDAATTALAVKQRAVFAGLRGLDPKLDIRTGAIAIREVRAGQCNDRGSGEDAMSVESMTATIDDAAAALEVAAAAEAAPAGAKSPTAGPCRLTGHVASTDTSVRFTAVKDAGTAVGLAGRLGASSARIDAFTLRNDAEPAQRALSAAMGNARIQATALAAASGLRLGPVVSITRAEPEGVTMFDVAQQARIPGAPAVMAPPPIVVDVAPAPVETSARIEVTFALLP